MKKNKFTILLVTMLVAILMLSGCTSQPNITVDTEGNHKQSINVEGQGEVTVSPDVAYLTVSVVTEEKDAKVAQEKNKEVLEEVYKKLNDLGVAEEDIETLSYNITEIRDYRQIPMDMAINVEELPNPVAGYQASNSIKVTIKDIDNVGNIIDGITTERYMTISNLSFGLLDDSKAKEEAIKLAVKDAQGKAKAIADSLDITIKGVSKVTLNDYYDAVSFRSEVMAMEGALKSTPIAPNNIIVNVRVTVEFSI